MLEIIARVISFPLGVVIVVLTLSSAVRTFVLPRSSREPITRRTFVMLRRVFNIFTRKVTTYERRDQIMALYAPIGLLMLPAVWLTLVGIGYTLMFWAAGVPTMGQAFKVSGSSLLTLGFSNVDGFLPSVLAFTEAMIGLVLIALLIAYLPTIYSAFSQREAAVAMLEIRAGSPPSAVEMFSRIVRIQRVGELHNLWVEWERWFVSLEETHTSLAALNFFRSPQHDRSWVTAAGAILDAAAFAASTLDFPRDAQTDLTIRAGYIALRRICDFFQIPYNPTPSADDPISIRREEFDEACDEMARSGVPLKADRDKAWRDWSGWRVNYDVPLLALAALMMVPYAPWSSDRGLVTERPPTPRKVESKALEKAV